MPVTAAATPKDYQNSTPRIMTHLFLRDMVGDTAMIKRKDPAVAEGTHLDCENAHLDYELKRLPNLNEIGDQIESGLKLLKDIGTIPAKQEFDIFNNLFSGPAKELKQLAQVRTGLIRRYADLVKTTRQSLQTLIQRINKSAEPATMRKSQDVVHGFSKVKAEIQVFASDIKKLARDQRRISNHLEELLTKMRASNHNIIPGTKSETTAIRPGASSGG